MKPVKAVGIRELKNNLSSYLQEVKRGLKILITDRHQVIAEIQVPTIQNNSKNPLLQQWIDEGILQAPLGKKLRKYPKPFLEASKGTAQKLIDEDRGE